MTAPQVHNTPGSGETWLVHKARWEDGRVVFVFQAGECKLGGYAGSVDEYRNYLAAFQAWHKVTLPGAGLEVNDAAA